MQNIEIKVRVLELTAVRKLARKLGTKKVGILKQVDIYYNYTGGRLKLRIINGAGGEIIRYQRPDTRHSRLSDYTVVPINATGVPLIRQSLKKLFGQWLVVHKKRELWMYRHTRIHLDTVEGLGRYVELETVLKGITPTAGKREYAHVQKALKLQKYQSIAGSYSDLLAAK